jgi:hypothetical protein
VWELSLNFEWCPAEEGFGFWVVAAARDLRELGGEVRAGCMSLREMGGRSLCTLTRSPRG